MSRRKNVYLVFIAFLVFVYAFPLPAQAAGVLVGKTLPSGTTATSSGSNPHTSESTAFDNNLSTTWTSGLAPGSGDWFKMTFPAPTYISAVQLVTSSLAPGNHQYRMFYSTCCENVQIGSSSIAVDGISDYYTTIPVTPGYYSNLMLIFYGNVKLVFKEIRLLPLTAPTGLAAVPGDGQAALSWSPISAPTFASYRIYQDGVFLDETTSASYTANGLVNGTSYEFAIAAVDADGIESERASWGPVVPLAPDNAPSAPTGLSAIPGDSQVELTWDANMEVDFERYAIYKNGALYDAYVYTNSYTVAGLTNGSSYSFTVSALDSAGHESPVSSPQSATPSDLTAPAVPTGLSVIPGEGQAALSWSANTEGDFDHYVVYRDGVPIDSNVATASYLAVGLTNGTAYAFAVSAVDAAGNASAPSSSQLATPADTTPPDAPTGFLAVPGDGDALLSWNASADADLAYYKVYQDGSLLADHVAVPGYLAAGLVNDTAYSFAVSAVDVSGNESLLSGSLTVTPRRQSLVVELDSHKLTLGQTIELSVKLRQADGSLADVTGEAELIAAPGQTVVQIADHPLRLTAVSTGYVSIQVQYQTYTAAVPIFVNYGEWLGGLVNPSAEPTSVAHLAAYAAANPLDLTGDGIFNQTDIQELLELVNPLFVE